MTETSRTTITLSKINMNLVNELIGVFGNTQAAVISNIVKSFFNNSNNFALLEELRKRKRKEIPPDESELSERITKYLQNADKIPFNVFVEHLKLDVDFVISHLDEWGVRYKFKIINNKIIKEK